MELKVTYKIKEKIDTDLDQRITKALKMLGFKMWACGYDLTNGVRDLSFDNES